MTGFTSEEYGVRKTKQKGLGLRGDLQAVVAYD